MKEDSGWKPQYPKRTIDPHNYSIKDMETDISVYKQRDEKDFDWFIEEDLNTLVDMFRDNDKCADAACEQEGVDYRLNIVEIERSLEWETLYHNDDKPGVLKFFKEQLRRSGLDRVDLRDYQYVVTKFYISLIDQNPEDDTGQVKDL